MIDNFKGLLLTERELFGYKSITPLCVIFLKSAYIMMYFMESVHVPDVFVLYFTHHLGGLIVSGQIKIRFNFLSAKRKLFLTSVLLECIHMLIEKQLLCFIWIFSISVLGS